MGGDCLIGGLRSYDAVFIFVAWELGIKRI